MSATLHLHGQAAWHDDARIVGDEDGLLALRDGCTRALAAGRDALMLYAADGEGYLLTVERDDALKEADHYYDLPGASRLPPPPTGATPPHRAGDERPEALAKSDCSCMAHRTSNGEACERATSAGAGTAPGGEAEHEIQRLARVLHIPDAELTLLRAAVASERSRADRALFEIARLTQMREADQWAAAEVALSFKRERDAERSRAEAAERAAAVAEDQRQGAETAYGELKERAEALENERAEETAHFSRALAAAYEDGERAAHARAERMRGGLTMLADATHRMIGGIPLEDRDSRVGAAAAAVKAARALASEGPTPQTPVADEEGGR